MKKEIMRSGIFTRRALLVAGGQIAVFGILGAKLYKMQVVDGEKYTAMARGNSVSVRLLPASRGRVFDRFGAALANNRQNWRALLMVEQTNDTSSVLDAFSKLVPLSDSERSRITRELHTHQRYVPVMLQDFLTWDQMALIEVNAPNLPGVLIDVGSTRIYPQSELLSHVVGYVAPPHDADLKSDPTLAMPGMRVGRTGVEGFNDIALRGHAGAQQLEVNAVGRVIRELDRQEGTPGTDIGLSIDTALQQATANHLAGLSASAVVMDPRNGEVLAMVSQPSFDPSLFDSGVSNTQWQSWMNDPRKPLVNKAAAGVYPPGSTFKPAVAMAGLSSGALGPDEMLNCAGHFDLGNARFYCWRSWGHGMQNVTTALKNSCDCFFYQVALRTGIDTIAAYARRFGIGTDIGMDLTNVASGFMPTKEWRARQHKGWPLGDTVVSGIGQGYILATPLSLATLCSRVATGRAVQPHVARHRDGVLQTGAAADDWPEMSMPNHYFNLVRQGMFEVINAPDGTGKIAKLPMPGVQMAGKTGSAQVIRVSRAQREHGFNSMNLPWALRPHALFIGFAPFDAPRYAVAVVVEHGNAGADAAGPVARDIMMDALTLDPAGRDKPLNPPPAPPLQSS
ncbi:penicillin-binding protein 2 [Acidisoma silvae]|uniref:Penicillin-binding protein 2 n=1 Tax=Acidisoma silvae TaxID=2802396 RepID=A0A963YPA0_9PROT|nr:penicillin-binding protein 2 [Acidisoma silvae]MCB8874648.1 penicillin-binding protein 2 [Acidisoma silvae]